MQKNLGNFLVLSSAHMLRSPQGQSNAKEKASFAEFSWY